MSALDTIVEDLKALPPNRVDDAAWFVHALVVGSSRDQSAMLRHTATALSAEDVDEMESAIAQTCEETDDHAW